ncbi:MAG: hypothetical protein WC453_04030 [Patescibacteria group bacterium]
MEYYYFKVYVGCSLTHAPAEFRSSVERLQERLKGVCQVLVFKGLADANIPHDVYVYDIRGCVYKCDLLVAICDFPSLGLGWEMATQAEKRKRPLLAVAHREAKVSKLVIDPQLPGYEFRRYDDLCEGVFKMVVARLQLMEAALPFWRRWFRQFIFKFSTKPIMRYRY